MTEAEYLASNDPAKMLGLGTETPHAVPAGGLLVPVSERKLKLWVEACRAEHDRRRPGKLGWPARLDTHLEAALRTWTEPNDGVVPAGLCADLLRDIIGNPFRPIDLKMIGGFYDPKFSQFDHIMTWRGGAVPALARRIDDTREFGLMPVLADALQDGGCADAELLGHCRGGGPHARGCWVIDCIFGNS